MIFIHVINHNNHIANNVEMKHIYPFFNLYLSLLPFPNQYFSAL